MMCEFLNGDQYHLSKLLVGFSEAENQKRIVTEKLKKDLLVWKAVVQEAKQGLPIGDQAWGPPILAATFVSDAAGAAYSRWGEGRVNATQPGDCGAASFGESYQARLKGIEIHQLTGEVDWLSEVLSDWELPNRLAA